MIKPDGDPIWRVMITCIRMKDAQCSSPTFLHAELSDLPPSGKHIPPRQSLPLCLISAQLLPCPRGQAEPFEVTSPAAKLSSGLSTFATTSHKESDSVRTQLVFKSHYI